MLVACTRAGGDPHDASSFVVLDDQANQLRTDFNRAKGSVRLLFVIDPICPTCLRGLADLDRSLLAGTADPRLVTFVVHEPVLGAARFAPWSRTTAAHDVPAAARLLHNPNVRHYWNPSGAFGRLLSSAVDLTDGERPVYAWDVWLLYGPEARWTGVGPPKPELLMQQLGALRGSKAFPHLDRELFAERARGLLGTLVPPDGGTRPIAASGQPRP